MAGVSFNIPGPITASSVGFTGSLEWKPEFPSACGQRFSKAQKFVDSEVLRYCDPLAPKVTGFLIVTGKLGTVLGSGVVSYTAIYSATQYYKTAQTRPYDANRGGMWFERMKVRHKQDILEGAKRIAGGG